MRARQEARGAALPARGNGSPLALATMRDEMNPMLDRFWTVRLPKTESAKQQSTKIAIKA